MFYQHHLEVGEFRYLFITKGTLVGSGVLEHLNTPLLCGYHAAVLRMDYSSCED